MTLADDPSLEQQRALKVVLWTGCGLTLMSAPFAGMSGTLSVALGVLIGALNLWVLTRSVRAFLSQQGGFNWGVFVVLKLLLVSCGLYLLFRAALVQGLPLMLGLGALPIGILLAQLAPRVDTEVPLGAAARRITRPINSAASTKEGR